MQIRENPEYSKVLRYFQQLLPVRTTDRKSDLEKLSQIERPFILHSVPRNGTTSLLTSLAQIKNGTYFDCHGFLSFKECKKHSKTCESGLIIYDEAITYLGKRCPEGPSFFIEASKEKQIGLRVHPNIEKEVLNRLISNGFELFRLEQMSLEEYQNLIDSKFREIGIKIPDEIVLEANSRFNALCPSNLFIGVYFETMIEEPERLSIGYVLEKTREINPWIFEDALIKR